MQRFQGESKGILGGPIPKERHTQLTWQVATIEQLTPGPLSILTQVEPVPRVSPNFLMTPTSPGQRLDVSCDFEPGQSS